MSRKPHEQDISQDRQTAAPKKPGSANTVNAGSGGAREVRLAEALRANLRRRKAGLQGAGAQEIDKKED
jgi:hypothetical protein